MATSPRISHFLICERRDIPDPNRIAASLSAAGSRTEATQSRLPHNFELAIAPNRSRVLVQFGEDLTDPFEYGSDFEILEDLVAEGTLSDTERARTCRFAWVGYWDHADRATVDALLRLLCERMAARVVIPPWHRVSAATPDEETNA